MEEPAQADVLGAAAAQVDIGGAQDSPALGRALFGKRNLKILQPDRHVAAVELKADQPAEHPERIAG